MSSLFQDLANKMKAEADRARLIESCLDEIVTEWGMRSAKNGDRWLRRMSAAVDRARLALGRKK